MRLISQAIPKRSPEEIRGKPDASDEWTEETHRRIDFLANLVRMVNSDARVASDQAAVLEKHIDRILEQYPEDQQDFWFLRLVGVLNQLRG